VTSSDSCYVGFDGKERPVTQAHQLTPDPAAYVWGGDTRTAPQILTVESPGLHLFSVWVREGGHVVDKIILARDAAYTPTDLGPPESARVPLDGESTFVRGDASGDGRVNVSDAIRLLLALFAGGAAPSCADAADANDSGGLDLADAIFLLHFLFQKGPAIPAPHPAPGIDPTADALECSG
jgi:hypothetical protein